MKSMSKVTKLFTLALVFCLTFSMSSYTAAADGDTPSPKTYTEDELDQILTDSGMTDRDLQELDFYEKEFIVQSSGEDLEFLGTSSTYYIQDSQTGELKPVGDGIQPLAIPSLKVEATSYGVVVGGVQMRDIYASFEWLQVPSMSPTGIYKDSIGISLPGGWEIQSSRYSGAVQVKLISGWQPTTSSGVGTNGQPSEHHMYGAVWNIGSSHGTPNPYKGTVKLTARKTTSSASNRTIATYIQAHNDPLGNYQASFTFGPLSITPTPSKGKADKATDDFSW
ncbi:hypothetical protein ACPV3A_17020 [Paenibacillus sp. Dod16]|uniref:hypothetical protein n=1 Tax=Paenibacillus sp. Dod16 TaxID=3416392 RepID=UPI003CE9DC4E